MDKTFYLNLNRFRKKDAETFKPLMCSVNQEKTEILIKKFIRLNDKRETIISIDSICTANKIKVKSNNEILDGISIYLKIGDTSDEVKVLCYNDSETRDKDYENVYKALLTFYIPLVRKGAEQ